MAAVRSWFVFFLLSGFCGLVYETIWLRLSMAQFGVTSPSLSILVSVFMGGLALGAWGAARLEPRLSRLDARGAMRAYALTELAIGVLAFPVPWAMRAGGSLLAAALQGKGPFAWYAAAFLWQALTLLPACAAMGATIPLGMLAIGKARLPGQRTSFSFLYLANVLGAVVGALLPAFVLVEVLGFRRTLLVAGIVNLGIGALALSLSREVEEAPAPAAAAAAAVPWASPAFGLVLLFFTGFCSMGIEVVWTRQFTPFLGTVVYAFALILAVYLAATFAGSALYRRLGARAPSPIDPAIWATVAGLGALALFAADVAHTGDLTWSDRMWLPAQVVRVILGVAPFSAALGFLTPQLVDRFSGGRPERAGLAYAVNTIGCILGPLLAGFVLLPFLSESRALLLLLLPFAAAAASLWRGASFPRVAWAAGMGGLVAFAALGPRSLAETFPSAQVVRDHTATSIAAGRGMHKTLLVNGVGMTSLTPATKMMAHLPMALLGRAPRSALVICFGMGTSFRSLRSWGVPTTAVELVPGVPLLFPYFHGDARQVLAGEGARIVVDDGRRFLETTTDLYDVIVVDPPPPVQAASSSLLYSREFYALVRAHLTPGGILQQWVPVQADSITLAAFSRALVESFREVRAFRGFLYGTHFLATDHPLAPPPARELAARLPPGAALDLVEWGPQRSAEAQFAAVLAGELRPPASTVPALEDDMPVNEYFLLRSY